MFPDSLLSAASSSNVFTRGAVLYRDGNVVSFGAESFDEYSPYVTLEGTVEGSYGDLYTVHVALDLDEQRVESHSCTCPAHESYDGMCKHAVALALQYLVQVGAVEVAGSSHKERRSAPQAFTSPEVERLMTAYAAQAISGARKNADSSVSVQEADPVEVTCIIAKGGDAYRTYRYDGMWRLGLKVARGKASYIVKRIDEVVDAWRDERIYSYGKNLEFVHRKSAFTERSNRLLEYVGRVVDAQWSIFTQRENRNYYYSGSKLSTKMLPLLPEQLAEILDIACGTKVVYEIEEKDGYSYYTKKRKLTVPVLDADPQLEVQIAHDAQRGVFELEALPQDAEVLPAEPRMFMIMREAVYRCSERFTREVGPFCANVYPSTHTLNIRDADMPQFCAAVLPALRAHVQLEAPDGLDAVAPPPAEFTFRVGAENGCVFCHAEVHYGEEKLDLFEPAYTDQPVRHVEREVFVQRLVGRYFPEGDQATPEYLYPVQRGSAQMRNLNRRIGYDGRVTYAESPHPFFYEDDDAAYYLLFTDGLRELSRYGEVLLSERLRGVSARPAPSVQVEASVASGVLDLSVDCSELSPEELVRYLASYRRKQRYVRLASGDIVSLDGSVEVLGDLADALGVAPEDLVGGGAQVPANRTLFVDALLKRAGGVRFERDEGFRSIVRDFETIADADFAVPGGLGDVLRSYQREGFKWLCTLGKTGFGGILADDMGLGKTLQMIAYFLHAREGGCTDPMLVVCPASLVYNWVAEIQRFAPDLRVQAVVGAKKARVAQIADGASGSYDVAVTSYDLMRRDIDALSQQHYHCAVLDEAQYIKNSSTKAAKAAKQLVADVRFAMTGTPIENRLSELWSIFDYLMPGVLGTADGFAKRFSTPIGNGEQGVAERLQKLVGPFILRRLKGDVLTDLPDKNESVVYAEMEGEQDKLYRASASRLARELTGQMPEEFASSKLQVLAELTKLRQLCCDPHLLYDNYTGASAKLETCIELVKSAVESGHSLLLFSQFTSMFALMEERLRKEGIGFFELTGATSKEDRMRLVERFQAGEVPVFLISLKAGGVGLNLTAADIVIHYDPWWNLAAQNQATDRAHRIGQEREVSVFKLIAKGTIEEKIVELQEKKRDLAESVLGGESVGAATITREDVLALLEA